ncbi:MAG TPA: MmgE/PrpD family protein [Candidatus Acidoferrales bacterium]|nr:MmgE/PrpD family protein [Candidatus Acidoferrales bacterium]
MVKSKEDSVDRRNFLKIAAGSAAALVASASTVSAQQNSARPFHEQTLVDTKKVDAPATGHTSETPADNPYTQGMATFVSGLRYEQIPEEVIDRIKLLILDSLGCAIYGAELEWSLILMHTLQQLDSSKSCGVWGTSVRLSAPHAALVNGTLVHGFELDDIHRLGVMHVGAVTLPSLLAVTEIRPGITGRDFLTAAVAGYEIGPRVGRCMGEEHIGQGWHSAATVGVFSSAAAAAAALRLTKEQTVHALGIAGTQSAGLMAAQYGSMVLRMHTGRSAQSGLYGGLLAANGFTGIVNVFESDYGGFCTTFSRSHDRFNLAELTAGLGSRFETMQVSLKFYSCVSSNHTTLDAIRAIRARRPFSVDDVDHVVVHGSQVTVDHVGWKYNPAGISAAQLNLPFCVATLLLDGNVFIDEFTAMKIVDPVRIALADRVKVVADPDIMARGSEFRQMVRVEVFLKDGTVMTETVETPRGSERSFASKADVVEKFENLAGHVLPAGHVAAIREAVLNLETLPDSSRLARLLTKQ